MKRLGFSAGASPARKLVAPSGSYRSGGGGDKAVEAFEKSGPLWRFGEQAGRNVSERRASPETTRCGSRPGCYTGKAAVLGDRGNHPSRRDKFLGFHRGIGGGMPVQGDPTQHGKPRRWGRVTLNRQPARARSGRARWRRGPYERGTRVTPGEQRGLSSRSTSQGARQPGDWR